jgi:Mn-dependent DtxR family transcriptional regulator
MTKDGPALTAANIRYLLVIRELDAQQHGVRGSDIAKQLGVTKPSVFAMTRNLLELGLVKKEKYGTVFLTEPGQQKADQYADCYALLLRQMEGSLRCTGADCRNAACELLAEIPEGELPKLRMRLRQKRF